MDLVRHADSLALGHTAGNEGGDRIAAAIRERGQARIVLATGASQFATLDVLTARSDIDWRRVVGFHLDEYLGLPADHPAAFRRYLHERFVQRAAGLGAFHGIRGDADDPAAECVRLGLLVDAAPIDVLFLGIGENGHLAFNDPPADDAPAATYRVVDLDDACRRQQVGEGWFTDLDAVPRRAISMSIHGILAARTLIASVPDARKAAAVRASVEDAVSPRMPGSYLRRHPRCRLHVDAAAAALLTMEGRAGR